MNNEVILQICFGFVVGLGLLFCMLIASILIKYTFKFTAKWIGDYKGLWKAICEYKEEESEYLKYKNDELWDKKDRLEKEIMIAELDESLMNITRRLNDGN